MSFLPFVFSFHYFSFIRNSGRQEAPIFPYPFPFVLLLNKEVSPQKPRLGHFTQCWLYICWSGNQKPKATYGPTESKFSTHQSRETLKIPMYLLPHRHLALPSQGCRKHQESLIHIYHLPQRRGSVLFGIHTIVKIELKLQCHEWNSTMPSAFWRNLIHVILSKQAVYLKVVEDQHLRRSELC